MKDDPLELLNFVANQPEVLPNVAPGVDAVDLSKFFRNPNNRLFGDDRGVVIFGDHGSGIYEMHYLFTDALRGRKALLVSRDAIRIMFTLHGAQAICGAVPRSHMAARVMSRALGFRPVGTATDNSGRACITYLLERASWECF